MKVLIVKMSSMGDLIHTLPAVTDAKKAIPDIQFDWVAEEGFAEIPSWHPAVDKVIPIAMRRWRKNIINSMTNGEVSEFFNSIKTDDYDFIIDAQGLIKSACITRLAKGKRNGMNSESCKESFAAYFYDQTWAISQQKHAIERVRLLFAETLGYTFQEDILNYGLSEVEFKAPAQGSDQPYLVFLHGTSADNKLWPIEQWEALVQLAIDNKYRVYLPWGNEQERVRAEKIAKNIDFCEVLSKMNLTEMAGILANAVAVVGVDTGLAHLAAALSIPGITLYVDTYPKFTGACGDEQTCISKMKTEQIINTKGLDVVYSEDILAANVWERLNNRLR